MPIVIVMSPADRIPAIISARSDVELLAALNTLFVVPALADVQAALDWVLTLHEPSGWFADTVQAMAYLDKFDGGLVKSAENSGAAGAIGQSLQDLAETLSILVCSGYKERQMHGNDAGRTWVSAREAGKLRARLARIDLK